MKNENQLQKIATVIADAASKKVSLKENAARHQAAQERQASFEAAAKRQGIKLKGAAA